jgi:DNA-binding NtrC family response regulator
VVRSAGEIIGVDCLPEETGGVPGGSGLEVASGQELAEVERRYILSEYGRLGRNKSLVAKSLGIGLKTLYRKLESYGEEAGGEL